jgi:hypothetical protein
VGRRGRSPGRCQLEQRKEGGRWEEEEAPTSGINLSATQGKRKKEAGRWAAAEMGAGPVGRCGLKGKEVRFSLFFFFFF